MAVYIDHKIDDTSTSLLTLLAWHQNQPLLAVASFDEDKGGLLRLYLDDGSPVDNDFLPKPGIQITSLVWHPSRKYLAVGWENGDLFMWNDYEKELHEIPSRHKQLVSVLRWSENGSWLISSDVAGICDGWKVDSKGALSAAFHHELKDSITDVVFKSYSQSEKEEEISRLARAAVSGDEKALNLFSGWTPQSSSTKLNKFKVSVVSSDSHDFYVGTVSGMVFYVSENGSCTDMLQMKTAIRCLLFYMQQNMLIVVTESLVIAQYQTGEDGTLTEYSKVKMSGRSSEITVIWAGIASLAVSAGERVVRLWNVDNGHNNILSLDDVNTSDPSEILTCLAFQSKNSVLAAGTSYGHIITWKSEPSSDIDRQEEETWQLQSVVSVQGAVRALTWGYNMKLMGVITATNIYILSEQEMCYGFSDQLVAVQLSAHHLAIEVLKTEAVIDLQTEVHVKSVFIDANHIAVSGGKKLFFYEVNTDTKDAKLIGSFSSESHIVAMHEQSVYVLSDDKIIGHTFQGTVKQTLTFTEEEGTPVCMKTCGEYLISGTSSGFLKIWDISRRDAKPHSGPKSVANILRDDGYIESVRCNCRGDKVSFRVNRLSKTQELPDPVLYVWDVEYDNLLNFDFTSGKIEDTSSIPESASVPNSPTRRAHFEMAQALSGYYPVSHHWVFDDSRLIVCEAKLLPVLNLKPKWRSGRLDTSIRKQQLTLDNEKKSEVLIVSLYATTEQGLLIQDIFALDQMQTHLLGVQVPYYYLLQKSQQPGTEPVSTGFTWSASANGLKEQKGKLGENKEPKSLVVKKTMRDFVGLEHSDKLTREGILSFSFYLTLGNMDEAFKAIKVIKNESVWENMARMCVKTKRLDVASVCLGKMGHARGAKALREASEEPELDARVAVLAVHLGMIEDAERLLKSCNRYDLLNKLYQDSEQWKKALEIAELHDRVHLRSTYYNFARHLEAKGDVTAAIPMYEKSETHHFEVSRMLFEEPRALEAYILKSKDSEMHRWWAQYLESVGEMETALQFYEAAEDYFSLVRVYCYCNNLEKAAEIANETGDRAACFHLGRQFENQDNIKESVHFLTRARAYNNAIRICKEHGLEDQLMNLALMSGPQEMAEVARYYEDKLSHQDKAVMLYHKAGYLTKAVELAFRTREFSALQMIASSLSESSDPELLDKCAQFFMENGQFEKAVDLLAVAKKYMKALDLCVEHNIIITDELAEKLTIEKDKGDPRLRSRTLEKIGECAMLQENYHLAAKKFTQAGNKIQAMKALLKSGDTEKIIFFAGVSRQREIYVMAANYLQSLDWRQDSEIMKNIINFYTKGKALDLLAGFYDACAQVEIDEYQHYEKALGALSEALKCMAKAQSTSSRVGHVGDKMDQLKVKMELVKQFVQLRHLYETSPDEAIKQCQQLLQEENLESAVRRGDVYGFLVEHFVRQQNFKMAYSLLEEMQAKMPGINLPYYVKVNDLKTIYKALDIQPLASVQFVGSKTSFRSSSEEGNENLSDNEVEEDYQTVENGY